MKKSELKSLIQTCIVEVLKEDDKSDKVILPLEIITSRLPLRE